MDVANKNKDKAEADFKEIEASFFKAQDTLDLLARKAKELKEQMLSDKEKVEKPWAQQKYYS